MKVDIFNTDKKYSIIYADPPWKYNKRNNLKTKFGKGADGHYPMMSIKEISKLNIPKIAADNCALFMWATTSKGECDLIEKLKLIKNWGFELVNEGFTWIKLNPKGVGYFFGVGHYTKSNAEHCYLGIKGSMQVKSNKVSSLIISPREHHSKKPDIVRDKIVELFGDLPRIELFARQYAEGWDCWGNEV